MNPSEWRRLVDPLLDDEWGLGKKLVFRRPITWVLRGVLWEASGSGTGFYLWELQMPLYQPVEHFDLSWSVRHGGGSQLYEVADTTRSAVAEAMSAVRKLAEIDSAVVDPPGGADNVGTMEVRAYGLYLEGNDAGAVEVLDRVLRYEPQFDWEIERSRRASSMRGKIDAGRREEVTKQLEAWRRDCLHALGILESG
jgi:hypothetical protein